MQQQQQKKFRPNNNARGNSSNVSFGEANFSRSSPLEFNNTINRPPTSVYNANMAPQVMVLAPNQHHIQANGSQIEGASFAQPPPTPSNKRPSENNEGRIEQFALNERTMLNTSSGADFCVFTGTVEKVIKWNKLYDSTKCLYEVIASIIAIQERQKRMQKVLLLRDAKGPVLQAVFYSCDRFGGEDYHVGQIIRCVGSMIGPNSLRAFSMRLAKGDEIATLQRFYYISDHAVMRAISNN